MSPKFKPSSNAKIQRPEPGCISEQYPHISFRYMTKNSDHNFDYIENCVDRDQALIATNLFRRLEEITKLSWQQLGADRKQNGYETLRRKQIKFKGTDANTEDSKVYVFRFDTHRGSGKGRIVGFKDSPCSALFVIGFDFDFDAYNH